MNRLNNRFIQSDLNTSKIQKIKPLQNYLYVVVMQVVHDVNSLCFMSKEILFQGNSL